MRRRSARARVRALARARLASLLLALGGPLPCLGQSALPSPPLPRPSTPTATDPAQGPGYRPLPPSVPALPLPTDARPGQGRPGPSDASPLGTPLRISAAPFAPDDRRFPINLATALRLSDARPLIVAAAQARVWVAEAELTRAKVLWLPDLNIGFDYIRHDGGGPDFNKGILTAPSTNFFYAGAGLWGNDQGIIHVADAIYQPLAARQVLNSRHWDVQTAKNDAVMQTADAYFLVHQHRGTYAATLYSVERGRELVGRIAALSRDMAAGYEVDRARNFLADLEQQAVAERQVWREQSARLTRVLRLDPRAVVEPLERDHAQVTLIDPGRGLDDLMSVALTNRPEVSSRRALIAAAEAGVRLEKGRPVIPNFAINGFQTPFEMLQAGIFGLGPNSSLNQWSGRDDISLQPVFQLRNMGIGNLAQIKAARGVQSLAIIDYFDAQDRVAEEVTQMHARLQSAAVRVVQAERSLRTGIITYNGSIEGLQQTSRFKDDVLTLVSRPQEAVYALQLLQRAFVEYYATVSDYNRAQFGLFHALGYPAAEVAVVRPPGELMPVDTERPPYLPPVGNGPPPATR